MSTKPGIRESAYFTGVLLERNPTSVSITMEVAETRQRARDGTLLVHRASPYAGAPMRYAKAKIALQWASLRGADIDTINDLISYGGPVGFTLWRPVSESFVVITTAAGVLQRLDASTQASPRPVGAETTYAATAWQSGAQVALSLSGPDANGRTPWSSSDAVPGVVTIRYYPLFTLYVAEGQPNFSVPQIQGQTLTLEEK